MEATLSRPKNHCHSKKNCKQNVMALPYWEREFIRKVGSFEWKNFIEVKKYVYPCDKIMQWDDRAGEETFKMVKLWFWEKFNDLPTTVKLPNPDSCVDEIDWDAPLDETLLWGLEQPVDDQNENPPTSTICHKAPQVGEIIPTGWDVDFEDSKDPLLGLLVGDDTCDDVCDCPLLRKFRRIE